MHALVIQTHETIKEMQGIGPALTRTVPMTVLVHVFKIVPGKMEHHSSLIIALFGILKIAIFNMSAEKPPQAQILQSPLILYVFTPLIRTILSQLIFQNNYTSTNDACPHLRGIVEDCSPEVLSRRSTRTLCRSFTDEAAIFCLGEGLSRVRVTAMNLMYSLGSFF